MKPAKEHPAEHRPDYPSTECEAATTTKKVTLFDHEVWVGFVTQQQITDTTDEIHQGIKK